MIFDVKKVFLNRLHFLQAKINHKSYPPFEFQLLDGFVHSLFMIKHSYQ